MILRTILAGTLLAIAIAPAARADLVVRYNFTGSPGNQASEAADNVIANVTASTLGRGSGLTAEAAVDSISSSNWSLGAIDANDYYGFTLTPNAGFYLTLSQISFGERRSGTGILNFEIRSSLDSFAAAISGTATSVPDNASTRNQSFALPTAFANLTSPVTLRIYGYMAESSGGTWRLVNYTGSSGSINGLTVDGSVAAIPEPTAFLFGGLVCGVIGLGVGAQRLLAKWHSRG